jgi:hypothetical protein
MKLMAKIITDTANDAGVGLDGLGLETFEPKVLQMSSVIALEC